MSVLDTIKSKYSELHRAERKTADYILIHPSEAVNYNVADLAEKSGVSDATVVRFCQKLGYSGYYQLRISLAQELGNAAETDSLPEKSASESETTLIARFFHDLADDLTAIGRSVEPEEFKNFISVLERADTVHIIAVGDTLSVARHLSFRLGRLGIRTVCDSDQVYFMNHIYLAGKNDAVLAVSITGSSKSVISAVDLARKKQLPVLAFTAARNSPLAKRADHCLFTDLKDAPFDLERNFTQVYAIAMVDVIAKVLRSSQDRKEGQDASGSDPVESLLSVNKL